MNRSAVSPGEQATLRPNTIGLGSSVIIGIAGSAPGQCLAVALVPLLLASDYGTVPSFAVATLAMLCIAIAFSRLNLWKQDAGGPYKWVSRAVHPYAGFITGWLLLATFIITVLVDILTLGPAVLSLLGLDASDKLGTAVIAMVVGIPILVVAAIGIRPTARLQNGFAIAEYAVILGFAVFAAVAIFVVHAPGTFTPTTDFLKFSGGGAGSLSGGILIAIFWIAEWDAGIYEAEETTKRERNPGLAAIIAVASLGVFYMIVTVLFSSSVPRGELEKHGENAIVYIVESLAGPAWGKLMAVAVLSSVLATLLASLTVSSRIALSMARDRVLPQAFAKVSPRFRTPVVGTVIVGVLTLALVWPYVFLSSVAGALDTLINTSSVVFVIYYALTGLTVVWLHRSRLLSSVKDFLFAGLLPLASAGFLIWVAYETIAGAGLSENLALIGIVVIGIVLLAIARFVYRAPSLMMSPEKIAAAESGPVDGRFPKEPEPGSDANVPVES